MISPMGCKKVKLKGTESAWRVTEGIMVKRYKVSLVSKKFKIPIHSMVSTINCEVIVFSHMAKRRF